MHQNSFSNVLASLMVNSLGGLSKLAGKEYTTCMKIALLLFKVLVLPKWCCSENMFQIRKVLSTTLITYSKAAEAHASSHTKKQLSSPLLGYCM